MNDNYNKISAVVMWLGTNTILKMNVSLFKSSKNSMIPAHTEYEYFSEVHHQNMTSIRLNYDYYLSIENTKVDKDRAYKGFFGIRYPELYLLNFLLSKVCRWFIDTEYNGLYFIKDNTLNVNPTMNVREELATDQCTLIVEPIVMATDTIQKPGVRFIYTKYNNYVDIDSSILFGFTEFLKRCDLFTMSIMLLSYTRNTPLGINKISMNPVQSQVIHKIIDTKGRGIAGRQIGAKKSDIDQL